MYTVQKKPQNKSLAFLRFLFFKNSMMLTFSGHSCYVCTQRNNLLKYEYEKAQSNLKP